jgi:hypothetical protein
MKHAAFNTLALLVAVLLFTGTSPAQSPPTEVTARLTAPLTTKLNRTGDMVVAKIVQPAQFAGQYLEGEIRDIHPGAGTKHAEIFFQFLTLHAGTTESPVAASVTSIRNSRQQAEVDEDGTAIEQEHSGAVAGRFSQLTGGLASRITKSAKPSASELTRLSAKSTSLSLAQGSEFTLQFSIPASKSK